VKQKTAADRLRRSIKRIAVWCRRFRHKPEREQWRALRRKFLGHFAYLGITGNYQALHNFHIRAIGVWRKWLSRRSQRAWMSREKMERLLKRYPLPPPAFPTPRSRSETVVRRAGCGKSARPDPWEPRRGVISEATRPLGFPDSYVPGCVAGSPATRHALLFTCGSAMAATPGLLRQQLADVNWSAQG